MVRLKPIRSVHTVIGYPRLERRGNGKPLKGVSYPAFKNLKTYFLFLASHSLFYEPDMLYQIVLSSITIISCLIKA